MSDRHADRPRPTPVRPPSPPPVREAVPVAPARGKPAPDTKPTPVRALMESSGEPAPPEVAPDAESVSLEVDGACWTVRVLGRSMIGAPPSATHVLLLAFAAEERPERALREAWAVGRSLSALAPAALEAAFRTSAPPREPGKRPFFDDGVRRARRDG